MIHALRKRGKMIANNNWKGLKDINEKLDVIMTPVSCFITFESEEGKQRCLQLVNPRTNIRILNEYPKLTEASEPTNIIWENR
jgi:hypothetical protein